MSAKVVSRRHFLKAAAAVAGGAALAACTPKPTPTPVVKVVKETVAVKETVPVKETVVAKPTGPVNVVQYVNANIFAEADAFTEAQAWTVALPKFNKSQKEVILRYEPVSQGEFVTKVAAMTAAKELGNALVWTQGKAMGEWAREKLFIPMDDLCKQAGVDPVALYDERVLTVQRFDPATNTAFKGPLWALPMTINPGVCLICYNLTMLKEAGIEEPNEKWTYDTILDAAKKVTKPGKWGLLIVRSATSHSLANDYSYIAPFGGYLFDREGKKALINSPGSMEGWTYIYDAIHKLKVSPTPDDYKAFGDYKQAHMASKLALYKEGPWGAMHYRLIPEKGKPGYIEAGEIPAPKGKSGRVGNTISGDSWGISVNATDPVACLKALLFMTSSEASIFRSKGAFSIGATKDFVKIEEMVKHPFVSNSIKAAAAAELPYNPANGRNKEVEDLIKQRLAVLDGGSEKVTQAFFDKLNGEIQAILDKPPA